MYYRCIRTCPTLWILLTFGVSFAMFSYALYKHRLPTFDDPLIGFEVRNSALSSRLNTWRLLSESTAWNGLLSLYPKPPSEELGAESTEATVDRTTSPAKTKLKVRLRSGKGRNGTRRAKNKPPKETPPLEYNPFDSKSHSESAFFCGKLLEDYVHFIVETANGENLLEVRPLQDICKLDKFALRMEAVNYNKLSANATEYKETFQTNSALSHFNNYCETKNHDQCCPSWTLPNFILLLANKSTDDCSSLTGVDIDAFLKLLRQCAPYYADRYLNEDCATTVGQCPNVPEQCYSHQNLVFTVFHYLVDYRFFDLHQHILRGNETNSPLSPDELTFSPFLTSTSVFLPMAKSSKLMAYYEAISNTAQTLNESSNELALGRVRVVAADLGLKHTLFSESLVTDLLLLLISSCIICASLLLYTRSLLLTATVLLTNLSSLGSAYFLYSSLFGIAFFPFLNILSIIILIGVGSDNALIYCKAWSCVAAAKSHSNRRQTEYHQLLSETLLHVLVSTFCASLTTCCAFFAGYFTEITSLKCFSIFAGISIVTNFLTTIITFPSSILLAEKFSGCGLGSFFFGSHIKLLNQIESFTSTVSGFIFNRIILKLVFNHRYLLSICFVSIAIGSGVLVIYSPGLQLPTSQEFQVFSARHPFERYDLKYKNEFWFSRFIDRQSVPNAAAGSGTALSYSNVVLPIRVVFGVLPIDNGDFLNPFDRGHLQFDAHFNISTREQQLWLLEFCQDLRRQPFYRPTFGPMLTNCFIEKLQEWMDGRRCVEVIGTQTEDRFPCCQQSTFPYEPAVFSECLVEFIERLHKTPEYMFAMTRAGPRFDSQKIGTVKAVVIEYDSVYDAFATSYEEMAQLWRTIDGWVQEQLERAPQGLQSGWFVTVNSEFFALQQSLSSGVLRSLLISVGFAFLTLVLTTWNIRLSLASTVSIACLIFTTIAALILLNWKLSIIESITISLTIGLAIDATLHYTIAYKLLVKGNRLLGIQMTLARIGSPVAMGALTTFLAGSVMLFSYILAYIQIGTFLMLLSIISWLYSTLFHLSLLSIFGAHDEASSSWNIARHLNRLWSICSCKRRRTISPPTYSPDIVQFSSKTVQEPNQNCHKNVAVPLSPHNGHINSEVNQILLSYRGMNHRPPSGAVNNNELRQHVCLRVTSI